MIHKLLKTTFASISILVLTINLSLDAQKLYSTTVSGNSVFEYDILSNMATPLGLFGPVNLYQPKGRLVHIGSGTLIGISNQSPNMYGAIYETDTSTNAVTILYEFTNNNTPQGGFALANNGKLYCLGNTGTANESRIYSFNPSTHAYDNVYEITGSAGGGSNLGGMVNASNGKLYGVTQRGGTNDKGMLYSFDPINSTFTKLYDFSLASGSEPVAAMIQSTNGKLYGVASYGGANDKGVIFSFDINANTYTKLYDFVQSTGESPTTPLYQASDGKLYGVTTTGGNNLQGVLYSFDVSTNTYTDLHDFWASEGYGPRAYPIEGASGVLYGTTNQGGANYRGSIYKFELTSSTFTKLLDGDNTAFGNFVSPFFSFSSVATGLNDVQNTSQTLTISPNPSTDFLQLDVDGKDYDYKIINALGQSVQQGALMNKSISIGTLEKGIYILQITDTRLRTKHFGRFLKE